MGNHNWVNNLLPASNREGALTVEDQESHEHQLRVLLLVISVLRLVFCHNKEAAAFCDLVLLPSRHQAIKSHSHLYSFLHRSILSESDSRSSANRTQARTFHIFLQQAFPPCKALTQIPQSAKQCPACTRTRPALASVTTSMVSRSKRLERC